MKTIFIFFIFYLMASCSNQPEVVQSPKSRVIDIPTVISDFKSLEFQGNRPSIMVVIASYNNERYVRDNLASILNQDYSNFRVYYVNDGSTDRTRQLVESYIRSHPKGHLVEVINNEKNKGSHVENQLHIVKTYSRPDDIVAIVDGDDQLADSGVLTKVAKVYSNYDIWLSYGQYKPSRGTIGHAKAIPLEVIENNEFRKFGFVQSHLRTFYAWLLLKVPEDELKYKGRFVNHAGDIMEMMPMSELAGNHIAFLDDILYLYNQENPISDFRIAEEKMKEVERDILSRKPLLPLSENKALVRTQKTFKIGVLMHATGKYNQFIQEAVESAQRHFLTHHERTFFIFTDDMSHPLAGDKDVVFIFGKAEPWPMGSMRRNEIYAANSDLFDNYDYLFATDVDISVVAPVGDEILGELVGTKHPGYNGKRGTYCSDPRYSAYVRLNEGEVYFMGGFFGGSREKFLALANATTEFMHTDFGPLENDPKDQRNFWHDESYLNRYFIDHPPTVTLSSSYGYQEGYKYPNGVTPKIRLVSKDNKVMHK